MKQLSLLNAKPLIEQFLKCQLPVMLWGPVGLGKSSLINQIGKEQLV